MPPPPATSPVPPPKLERPAPPTGLTATAVSSSEIDLSWTASAGATGYFIERSANGNTNWYPFATIRATTYHDTNLSPATTYYYRVRATGGEDASTPSAFASATTPTPPSAPTGLTATAGSGQVSLSWAAITGAATYNLYRGLTPGGEGTTPYKTGLSGTSYTDTGLTSGTTYYFTVKAVGPGGESAASNEAHATPTIGTPTHSQSQAVGIAAAFCQAVGAPVDVSTAVTEFPAPNPHPGQQDHYWLPRWRVHFGSNADVEVVDGTGGVNWYYNFALSRQLTSSNQSAGTPITAATALQTAASALQATGQTEPLGTATDQNFQITSPATAAGDLWYITRPRQSQGVSYRDQQATVMLQAETGALQALSLTFLSPPAPSATATVTSSQASATAQAQVQGLGIQGATAQTPILQFVQPNGFWQSGGSGSPSPGAAVQLAWVCSFTVDANIGWDVWVDAGTGAVIGGGESVLGKARKPLHREKALQALQTQRRLPETIPGR